MNPIKSTSWCPVVLGAINGVLFGGGLELILRLMYEYQVQDTGTSYPTVVEIDMAPYPFSPFYLPLLSLVFVTLSSLLVHNLLARRIKSSVWLWQMVGFLSLLECYLYALGFDLWNTQFSNAAAIIKADYWKMADSMKFEMWAYALCAVAIFNLIFGVVLRIAGIRCSSQGWRNSFS